MITMNSLNLTTSSLPSEKPKKRQWETHFSAKYVFASHLLLPVEVAYKKAYRLTLVKMVCRKIIEDKSCCPEENHNQEV